MLTVLGCTFGVLAVIFSIASAIDTHNGHSDKTAAIVTLGCALISFAMFNI